MMRTINLELESLEDVVRRRKYRNKKGNLVNILKNVSYKFTSEYTDFTCELYMDSDYELGLTYINGKTPDENYEFFNTIEFGYKYEIENFFITILNEGNLLIDMDEFFNINSFNVLEIKANNQDVISNSLFISLESIYLMNENYQKRFYSKKENEWLEPLCIHEVEKEIRYQDILDIDFDNEIITLFTLHGIFTIKDESYSRDSLLDLKNLIKQRILLSRN